MDFETDFVRPLHLAENSFLQLLLTEFLLEKSGEGFHLSVAFDGRTQAIWTRHAKSHVLERIPRFREKRDELQGQIEARLLHGHGEPLAFHDPEFPFRFVSGGVLPILWMNGTEYFCLFYRDIEPIGWNIANGGSDSRAECLYPASVIEREFREELIALKLPRKGSQAGFRYVFNWESAAQKEHVDHVMARRLWKAMFPGADVESFPQLRLPVRWIEGPDSLSVQMGSTDAVSTSGCFLNINAIDFGIEVDKIAHIHIEDDADDFVLLDGEIMDQKALGRPVGLFPVDQTLEALREGRTEWIPEMFFHQGRRRHAAEFKPLIEGDFTSSLPSVRTPAEIEHFRSFEPRFGPCPVTRSIMTRYAAIRGSIEPQPPVPKTSGSELDVFISCGQGDEALAEMVFEHVTRVRGCKAFFYRRVPEPNYIRKISAALDSAQWLILVGSDPARIARPYVQCECDAFLNAIFTGRKPNGKLIPYLPGLNPRHVDIFLGNWTFANTLAELDALMDS